MDSIVFGPIRWCVWSFRPSSPLRLPHLKFLFVCLFNWATPSPQGRPMSQSDFRSWTRTLKLVCLFFVCLFFVCFLFVCLFCLSDGVFGRFDLAALCGCRTLNFCLFVFKLWQPPRVTSPRHSTFSTSSFASPVVTPSPLGNASWEHKTVMIDHDRIV